MSEIKAVVRRRRMACRDELRYVARPVTYSSIGTEEVLARAAENSNIDRGALSHAFYAIEKEFKNFLLTGHTVRLGVIGTFRPSFSCRSGARREDVRPEGITCRRIVFMPSVELKREHGEVDYVFVDPEDLYPDTGDGAGAEGVLPVGAGADGGSE